MTLRIEGRALDHHAEIHEPSGRLVRHRRSRDHQRRHVLGGCGEPRALGQGRWVSRTTRNGLRSTPCNRTVRAGSSASAVPTPIMIASWVERMIWTRRSAIGPVMRRRASLVPAEANPSAVSASLSVTHGHPAVTRRVWPRWSVAPEPRQRRSRRRFPRLSAAPTPLRHQRIRVLHRRDDAGHTRRDDSVYAGRRGAEMRAGLERHVERRATRGLASPADRNSLGVRPSAWRCRPASDDRPVLHQDRADGGVGAARPSDRDPRLSAASIQRRSSCGSAPAPSLM